MSSWTLSYRQNINLKTGGKKRREKHFWKKVKKNFWIRSEILKPMWTLLFFSLFYINGIKKSINILQKLHITILYILGPCKILKRSSYICLFVCLLKWDRTILRVVVSNQSRTVILNRFFCIFRINELFRIKKHGYSGYILKLVWRNRDTRQFGRLGSERPKFVTSGI